MSLRSPGVMMSVPGRKTLAEPETLVAHSATLLMRRYS